MSIISLLVALIIIGLIFWAVSAISSAMAIPAPVVVVIQVVLVIIVIMWLLQSFGMMSGGPVLRLR
jgi:hypothetical protein